MSAEQEDPSEEEQLQPYPMPVLVEKQVLTLLCSSLPKRAIGGSTRMVGQK